MWRAGVQSVADTIGYVPSKAIGPDLQLEDGARVAVVGGGPAGSFFSYFLLKFAAAVDLRVDLDLYEARSFARCGPGGCNHCGGIVSESLVQILATEGIRLPPDVVQSAIESYRVHMDVGSVTIASPAREQRIAALYRGNGPRGGDVMATRSFDAYLQLLAEVQGARVVRSLISGISWKDGYPWLRQPDGTEARYDLVVIASGVNSNLLSQLGGVVPAGRPKTTRTYICEFQSTPEAIQAKLGRAMHVFLLDIPRLEFAALIPKGRYITMCLLGDDLDQALVHEFLSAPEVQRLLPDGATPAVCTCSPLINVAGLAEPYGDRLLLIGDSGVTRLYKDGIGAAFRTAKAAAVAAVLHGISKEAFAHAYAPACRTIARDNVIGKVIFGTTTIFKHSRIARRAILRMTEREQATQGTGHMSRVLWNMFTGSAPYREIFVGTLHPAFLGHLLWNLVLGMRPGPRTRQAV